MNCAQFLSPATFSDFVDLVNASTAGNISLASQCAPQICQNLWGTGNADISGIGMSVGYVMSNVLGPVLGLFCLYSSRTRRWWPANRPKLWEKTFESYYECAAFFSLSIQIACMVALTRVSYGLASDDMGDLTVRITWTVANLSMLPLAYRAFLSPDHTGARRPASPGQGRHLERASFVFPLFAICWAIFMYTFFNKMASTFAPREIGSGDGAVISDGEWEEIEAMCTVGWEGIAVGVDRASSVFTILASFVISVLAVGRITWEIAKGWALWPVLRTDHHWTRKAWHSVQLVLWVVLPMFAVGLTWSFFALQASQRELANSMSNTDPVDDWSFGQIVSVVVFAPVLVEFLRGVFAPKRSNNEDDEERLDLPTSRGDSCSTLEKMSSQESFETLIQEPKKPHLRSAVPCCRQCLP